MEYSMLIRKLVKVQYNKTDAYSLNIQIPKRAHALLLFEISLSYIRHTKNNATSEKNRSLQFLSHKKQRNERGLYRGPVSADAASASAALLSYL